MAASGSASQAGDRKKTRCSITSADALYNLCLMSLNNAPPSMRNQVDQFLELVRDLNVRSLANTRLAMFFAGYTNKLKGEAQYGQIYQWIANCYNAAVNKEQLYKSILTLCFIPRDGTQLLDCWVFMAFSISADMIYSVLIRNQVDNAMEIFNWVVDIMEPSGEVFRVHTWLFDGWCRAAPILLFQDINSLQATDRFLGKQPTLLPKHSSGAMGQPVKELPDQWQTEYAKYTRQYLPISAVPKVIPAARLPDIQNPRSLDVIKSFILSRLVGASAYITRFKNLLTTYMDSDHQKRPLGTFMSEYGDEIYRSAEFAELQPIVLATVDRQAATVLSGKKLTDIINEFILPTDDIFTYDQVMCSLLLISELVNMHTGTKLIPSSNLGTMLDSILVDFMLIEPRFTIVSTGWSDLLKWRGELLGRNSVFILYDRTILGESTTPHKMTTTLSNYTKPLAKPTRPSSGTPQFLLRPPTSRDYRVVPSSTDPDRVPSTSGGQHPAPAPQLGQQGLRRTLMREQDRITQYPSAQLPPKLFADEDDTDDWSDDDATVRVHEGWKSSRGN